MEEVHEACESTDLDENSLSQLMGTKPPGFCYMHVLDVVSQSPSVNHLKDLKKMGYV